MNKPLTISGVLLLCYSFGLAQHRIHKQPATLGIHFVFDDFETASAIQSSSLSSVLREKQFARIKDMSQGLAISYGKGLSEHFDFTSSLIGTFLAYPIKNRESFSGDFLLMEADASIKAKMFSDKYWFVPYAQAGVGISKYKGYWGTFIPAGLGLQISFFEEAYLIINSQYRIAITETVRHHFVYSIGLAGNIGSRPD